VNNTGRLQAWVMSPVSTIRCHAMCRRSNGEARVGELGRSLRWGGVGSRIIAGRGAQLLGHVKRRRCSCQYVSARPARRTCRSRTTCVEVALEDLSFVMNLLEPVGRTASWALRCRSRVSLRLPDQQRFFTSCIGSSTRLVLRTPTAHWNGPQCGAPG